MKVTFVTFCLIGAVFANPISFSAVLLSSELDSNSDSNSTESLSVSQSSENDTSEIQSSEENVSNPSSESQSAESTSEDTTSEESNSQSEEIDGSDSLAETRDDSMGSEENVRKSWVQVFASVIKILSAEDNSTEVKSQSMELTGKQPPHIATGTTLKHKNTAQGHTDLHLVEANTDSSDTTSDSSDTSDTSVTSDSSQSTSKESNESMESEESDSSDASKSTEDSNASDSAELKQIQDCVNGTQSCESEEYFFQDIGDDAHYSLDNLMVPDDDERELMLRR
ncbi:secretory calcium-binding phosphoprotein 1 [Xyrichtys novacula]|uniref:Secretory calcium-binding phosphoprotein 1 n=1 Tax=Xyrichtys novacula TaxID=13765 RepID=A0AAV1EUB8_XYRNO|nr:secretory calcium-binding phosphoprotein 1 [Xyrichtys novacula]